MKKRLVKIILFILLIISITIYVIINNYLPSINEEILIDDFIEETSIDKTTTSVSSKKRIIKTTRKTTEKSNYLMVLEIPKINLKKGIYYKDNKLNNVDNNVAILPSSSMPDDDKGSVILASHNGNTRVSYFKYLERLNSNDTVYLYYKGKKYEYTIYKSEIVDKVGTIKIKKDSSVSNIVLISCKNGTKDKQIVYIGKLTAVNNY